MDFANATLYKPCNRLNRNTENNPGTPVRRLPECKNTQRYHATHKSTKQSEEMLHASKQDHYKKRTTICVISQSLYILRVCTYNISQGVWVIHARLLLQRYSRVSTLTSKDSTRQVSKTIYCSQYEPPAKVSIRNKDIRCHNIIGKCK